MLGGNLELTLVSGVDPSTLLGTSFCLFDWTGVTPDNEFNVVNGLADGYGWDTSSFTSAEM